MNENLLQALSHPQDNGIVIFISGFLLALGVYHFLLFFQNKDSAYLYYSLYAFLVFIYSYHRAKGFILSDLSKTLVPYIKFFYDPVKWLYSTVYLLFAITFVDLDKYCPKWYKFLVGFVKISLISVIILSLLSFVLHNKLITDYAYNFVFLPFLFVLSIYILFLIWKTASPVKYYLLIGAGTYLLVTTYSHYLTYTGRPFRVLFYGATAFEMTLFALGLGRKQKLILEEKNLWQELIIKEHEENLKIKEMLNQKLDEEVSSKTEQIQALQQAKQIEEQKKLALAYSKQILQLRLQAVQAQMNPHFLFNSLNAIKKYIISNEQKEAVLYLTKFAKLLRMVLENAKKQEITLKDELDLMKIYIDVENIRFNKGIQFDILIASEIDLNKVKIPPLIFQAFLENAIWHGLAPLKGDKRLVLNIKSETPYVVVEIEDNGIGREKAKIISQQKNIHLKKESLGLKITEERLAIYTQAFKNKYKIQFIDLYDQSGKPTGTRVVVHIPVS